MGNKSGGGELRPPLNQVSEFNSYSLPQAYDLVEHLGEPASFPHWT